MVVVDHGVRRHLPQLSGGVAPHHMIEPPPIERWLLGPMNLMRPKIGEGPAIHGLAALSLYHLPHVPVAFADFRAVPWRGQSDNDTPRRPRGRGETASAVGADWVFRHGNETGQENCRGW